jgi:DNA-binding MarR family transcriptional regulator
MKKYSDLAKQCFDLAPQLIRLTKTEIQTVASGKLTHPQYRILANIRRGLNTVGEIAKNHGVAQPTMSKMVEGLVSKGIVQRVSSASDRRQIILELTREGQELFTQTRKSAEVNLSKKLKKINVKELQKLEQAFIYLEKFLKEWDPK